MTRSVYRPFRLLLVFKKGVGDVDPKPPPSLDYSPGYSNKILNISIIFQF